jgi:hypothetical protein
MTISTLSRLAELYNPKNKKFNNYLSRAWTIGLNSTDMKSRAHTLSNKSRDQLFEKDMKDASLLQCIIDLPAIIPSMSYSKTDNEVLKCINCGSYRKNKYYYETLVSNIQNCVGDRRIIYIMLGMDGYGLDDNEDELVYSVHSTSLVMVPRDDKYYAYYINSHGRDIMDMVCYDKLVTRRRVKKTSFNIPYELVFIRDLINYWNTLSDSSGNPINIYWDTTIAHTYLSTNLQAGDQYGTCFMYPHIIWEHMGEFYSKKKKLCCDGKSLFVDTGDNLLKHGNLSIFVKYAFTGFCGKYRNALVRYMRDPYEETIDSLEGAIVESRIRFIKCMLCSLIRYLYQMDRAETSLIM